MIRLPQWVVVVLALAFVLALTTPALGAETLKGKIKSIAADKDQIVVTDATGKDFTFHMDQASKVRVGTETAKLADLKVAAEVTITYEKKGDRLVVTEIRCEK